MFSARYLLGIRQGPEENVRAPNGMRNNEPVPAYVPPPTPPPTPPPATPATSPDAFVPEIGYMDAGPMLQWSDPEYTDPFRNREEVDYRKGGLPPGYPPQLIPGLALIGYIHWAWIGSNESPYAYTENDPRMDAV